jgi:hypothetical protein
MKKLGFLAVVLALCGCTQAKTVLDDVLNATQYACILDHQLDVVPAGSTAGQVITAACNLDPALASAVEAFLAVGAAHRVGVADAGK